MTRPTDRRALARIFPAQLPKSELPVGADDPVNVVAKELACLRVSLREAREREQLLRSQLVARIGPFEQIVGNGWKATWKVRSDGTRALLLGHGKNGRIEEIEETE